MGFHSTPCSSKLADHLAFLSRNLILDGEGERATKSEEGEVKKTDSPSIVAFFQKLSPNILSSSCA